MLGARCRSGRGRFTIQMRLIYPATGEAWLPDTKNRRPRMIQLPIARSSWCARYPAPMNGPICRTPRGSLCDALQWGANTSGAVHKSVAKPPAWIRIEVHAPRFAHTWGNMGFTPRQRISAGCSRCSALAKKRIWRSAIARLRGDLGSRYAAELGISTMLGERAGEAQIEPAPASARALRVINVGPEKPTPQRRAFIIWISQFENIGYIRLRFPPPFFMAPDPYSIFTSFAKHTYPISQAPRVGAATRCRQLVNFRSALSLRD